MDLSVDTRIISNFPLFQTTLHIRISNTRSYMWNSKVFGLFHLLTVGFSLTASLVSSCDNGGSRRLDLLEGSKIIELWLPLSESCMDSEWCPSFLREPLAHIYVFHPPHPCLLSDREMMLHSIGLRCCHWDSQQYRQSHQSWRVFSLGRILEK